MAMKYERIDVRPLAGALGAEIFGADLSAPLDNKTASEIHQAFLDHLVIFFRDQELTPEQHKAFSRRFGSLLEVPFVRAVEGHPEILPVRKGAKEVKARNFGGRWHSDMSYVPEPPLGSALYARMTPPYGGDTMWANMYLAYDTLSEGMKRMLDGLGVMHSALRSYGPNGAVVNNGDPAHAMDIRGSQAAAAEVAHPAVRIHPETGRKALYINSTYSVRFEGMTEEESRPLLEYLYQHAARPEFTCRFRWAKGSLALWDNRCTQHFAINDYNGFDRELHRTTIAGDRPIPAAAST